MNQFNTLSITTGGTTVSDINGYLTTSRLNATVVTFENNFPDFPSYIGGAIRQGYQFNSWSAPGNDTSKYLSSSDPSSTIPTTIIAPSGTLWKYFGLYWGSIDSFNSIEFWRDNIRIAYYNGSDIVTMLGLTSTENYINFDANNDNGYFNRIILGSTLPSFESDNHAFILTGNNTPSVTLAVSPTSVTEDGTPNLVYTFTRTGSTTSALAVNYSITGTADSTDYTGATPGTGKTITFAAGSSTASLTIDPTADTTVEPDETVSLTLATGTGYTVGTTTAITGTILNDDYTPNANDYFANSIVLIGQNITATGSNLGFTGQTGEPDLSGVTNSAWWNWTAPSSDLVIIDTIGSNFDTYLFVFTGNAVNNLNLIIANDDDGRDLTSEVSFTPIAGITYQIAVDGYIAFLW